MFDPRPFSIVLGLAACGARTDIRAEPRTESREAGALTEKTFAVSPGWDVFPKLDSGTVAYSTSGAQLTITYALIGAEPSQTYVVGFDAFGANVAFLGVQRSAHLTVTREGVTATVDVFPILSLPFQTDPRGNGSAAITLDISAAPAGTYRVQFWWARMGNFTAHYRTGQRFGVGFVEIVR